MRQLRHRLLTLCLVAASHLASADSQWYQIEMIVFAHQDDASLTEENWPDDIDLRYPSDLKMLFDPVALPDKVDENFTTGLDINVPNLLSMPLSEATDPSLDLMTQDTPETQGITGLVDSGENVNAPGTTNEEEKTARPLAFQRLDNDAKSLREAYQHLRRINRYKPLFHESWQQPLTSREQSASLLVTGGDKYGSHFELEGSVKISVERYLHIETDLWLHSFMPNFGQQTTLQVPPLPNHIERNNDTLSPFSFLVNEPYRVTRTVTLRQNRRMRSGEIHYLDHPLMGVIVTITPLEQD